MAASTSAAAGASSSSLLASLETHNQAFEALLSLIPARHYIRDEAVDDEYDNKYMKNKRNKATPKQELKERSKKAKKDKLDPSNHLTVPEILSARAAEASTSSKNKRAAAGDSDDESDASVDDATMDEAGANPQPLPAPTSITQLHAKLAARIAKLQGARFGTGANAGFEPGSKEELLEEARIRRGELREKRRKKTREEKKLEKKQGGKDEGWKKKTADDFTAKAGKTELLVPQEKPSAPAASSVAFSQFTLPSTFGAGLKGSKKSGKPLPSNPTQALAVLEKKKEKLAALPAEVRSEKEEQVRWETALERAEGGKVRDDVTRLKKAAKRKEKEKAKSSSEWADRKEQLRSTQEIKQKKRSDNISKKLEDRKNARKGIKPKGDKKSFKKAGGPSGGSGGSKSRGGFEGKKGPGGGGGGGGGGKK